MFELSKKQEETKLQELKKDEAVAQQYAKQLEVEREKVHPVVLFKLLANSSVSFTTKFTFYTTGASEVAQGQL